MTTIETVIMENERQIDVENELWQTYQDAIKAQLDLRDRLYDEGTVTSTNALHSNADYKVAVDTAGKAFNDWKVVYPDCIF